jgi:hypothetical protein
MAILGGWEQPFLGPQAAIVTLQTLHLNILNPNILNPKLKRLLHPEP